MFYSISSSISGCPPQPEKKGLISREKVTIIADVVLTSFALLGAVYAILNLTGVNLGPLNALSGYFGQDGFKILLGFGGGILALQLFAALITRKFLNRLEAERTSKNEQIQQLQDQINTQGKANLQELDNAIQQLQQLNKQVDESRQQISEYKQIILEKNQQYQLAETALKAEIDLLKLHNDDRQTENANLKNNIEEFKNKNAELEQKVTQAESNLAALQKTIERLQTEYNAVLAKANLDHEIAVDTSKKQLEQLQEEISALSRQKAELEQAIETLSAQLRHLKEANESERSAEPRAPLSKQPTEKKSTPGLFNKVVTFISDYAMKKAPQDLTLSSFEREAVMIEKNVVKAMILEAPEVMNSIEKQLEQPLEPEQELEIAEVALEWGKYQLDLTQSVLEHRLTQSVMNAARQAPLPLPLVKEKIQELKAQTTSLQEEISKKKEQLKPSNSSQAAPEDNQNNVFAQKRAQLTPVKRDTGKEEVSSNPLAEQAKKMMAKAEELAKANSEEFDQEWDDDDGQPYIPPPREPMTDVRSQFNPVQQEFKAPMKPSAYMEFVRQRNEELAEANVDLRKALLRRNKALEDSNIGD